MYTRKEALWLLAAQVIGMLAVVLVLMFVLNSIGAKTSNVQQAIHQSQLELLER